MDNSTRPTTFTIPLTYNLGMVDIEALYRVKDVGGLGCEIHREVVTQQSRSGFTIQVEISDIYHGSIIEHRRGLPEPQPATLLLFHFHLVKETTSTSRRVHKVSIELTFEDKERIDIEFCRPKITHIQPGPPMTSKTSTTEKETTTVLNAHYQGFGASHSSRALTPQNTQAQVSGIKTWSGQPSGARNVVRWIMDENPATKDGVPRFLQTAVLLSRFDDSQFTLRAEVVAHVDSLHKAEAFLVKWLGKQQLDDPVTFDPAQKWGPDTPERRVICGNLGDFMKNNTLSIIGDV
ncbi:hypothetical protein BGX38DRAFT_1173586 [Terfezia claveryi]|nr:hypothetical protein BGX38DRAFT_1173586 [Terfezia claveryi]